MSLIGRAGISKGPRSDGDGDRPQAVLRELASAGDPGMWLEVTSIVRELGWRMREIERTSLLRAGLLSSADLQVMQEIVTRVRSGEPTPA